MTRSTIVAVLMITAASFPTWFASAKAQESHEAHHPPQAVSPVQTETGPQAAPSTTGPTTQAGQAQGMGPGMMGGMPMMNMMGGNMSMMNMMGMMSGMAGPDMAGMATIDRVEGRIAFLRTELKITDAQATAWNAFADAIRANAKRLGELRVSMMTGRPQTATLADRLDLQERWFAARLEGTRAFKAAFVNLSSVLSDEQKKTANELVGPHMGMMTMMSGMMQSGQPGQMMPGPMMRQPGK